MVVKHVNKNMFDLFFNTGWENWARFQVANGKVSQVMGERVPKNIQIFLDKRYGK